MKAKTYSALQKTYDQAYLTCSTAVYYEGQGNEVEALRCWRECLGQLQGHNSAGHRPRSETERTLLRSLKAMQDQCQERSELLQALLISRVEAENNGHGWRNKEAEPVKSGLQVASTAGNVRPAVLLTSSHPLPPPVPPRRLPSSGSSSVRETSRTSPPSFHPATTPLHAITPSSLSRAPSPEKRAFLSTLRPARKQKKTDSRIINDGPEAAAKAATLAWSSLSRAEGAHLSRAMTEPPTDPLPVRQSFVASASTNDLSSVQRAPTFTVNRRPSPPPSVQPRPGLSGVRSRPHSSIYPLGNPPYPEDSAPPPPPPHGYFPASSESIRALHLPYPELPQILQPPVENAFRYSRAAAQSTPALPPRVPPKPVKSERLSHVNNSKLIIPSPEPEPKEESDSEYYKPPTVMNSRNTIHPPVAVVVPKEEDRSTGPPTPPPEEEKPITSTGGEEVPPPTGNALGERVAKALESISKGVDMNAAMQVANEIVVKGDEVHWDDVAGLDAAKLALKEAVVYPFLRPDLFSGLREPARGMLLFGPPGTGKTMLARAVATESKSTFFSISASSLTSKYLGESEKLVRALFALAKAMAPSIIFVDEIDSLLSSRSGSGEHEATRRIKTEFLIQWSDLAKAAAGKETSGGDASRVLVLAATNLPWAIDEAARRRFVRRQYIPLPEDETRKKHLQNLLGHQNHHLDEGDMERLIELTAGFSGSDITALAKDAAMGPLRSLGEALLQMRMDDIRPITFEDFEASLKSIRPSVSKEGLQAFEDWAKKFGERV
ncbi:AAA-domain-containing protein [Choiromyces venosus 120613-1]|uniref:AAA-domain-containing protein n=1 Tax=Choiromyces venosus 120613-1 TaxID=1336337 RepID=A0A3N4JKM1_9PEZI|nr:AAA-domain-containing protein [Choiromyces venosus 120613-1]